MHTLSSTHPVSTDLAHNILRIHSSSSPIQPLYNSRTSCYGIHPLYVTKIIHLTQMRCEKAVEAGMHDGVEWGVKDEAVSRSGLFWARKRIGVRDTGAKAGFGAEGVLLLDLTD